MFLTAPSNRMTSLAATPNSGRPDDGQERQVRRPDRLPAATPTPAPLPDRADTLDLRQQIAEALESDLDYQILRKNFPLETDPVRDGEQLSRSSERLETLDVQLSASTPASTTADLQVSWTQASASRLEFSARGGEASIAFSGLRSDTLELSLGGGAVQLGDPLVLDLGGKGLQTTGIEAGTLFDLNGDGRTERMSTVTGDSWFLALDSNFNGRIDDGRELFGDQNGAEHGFAELARHDANGDNRIDADDEVFARLRLVQFGADGTQVSQSLNEANVVAIELGHQNVRKALNLYDQVAQSGHFTRADGSQGEAADVLLAYRDLA